MVGPFAFHAPWNRQTKKSAAGMLPSAADLVWDRCRLGSRDGMTQQELRAPVCWGYFGMSSSSMSKISTEFGPMSEPAPRAP